MEKIKISKTSLTELHWKLSTVILPPFCPAIQLINRFQIRIVSNNLPKSIGIKRCVDMEPVTGKNILGNSRRFALYNDDKFGWASRQSYANTMNPRDPVHLHRSNVILACLSNYIHHKMWHEISDSFSSVDGCTVVDVWECIIKIHLKFYRAYDYLFMLKLKLNHVSESVPCSYNTFRLCRNLTYSVS